MARTLFIITTRIEQNTAKIFTNLGSLGNGSPGDNTGWVSIITLDSSPFVDAIYW